METKKMLIHFKFHIEDKRNKGTVNNLPFLTCVNGRQNKTTRDSKKRNSRNNGECGEIGTLNSMENYVVNNWTKIIDNDFLKKKKN